MSTSVCRVCLASDKIRKTRPIRNSLLEVYKILANIKNNGDGNKKFTLCFICHWELQRCSRFYNMAQRSEKILQNVTQEKLAALNIRQIQNLSTTQLQTICIDGVDFENVLLSTDIKTAETIEEIKKKVSEPVKKKASIDKKEATIKETSTGAVKKHATTQAVQTVSTKAGNKGTTKAVKQELSTKLVTKEASTEIIKKEAIADESTAVIKEIVKVELDETWTDDEYTDIEMLSLSEDGNTHSPEKENSSNNIIPEFCCGVCQITMTTKIEQEKHLKTHTNEIYYPKTEKRQKYCKKKQSKVEVQNKKITNHERKSQIKYTAKKKPLNIYNERKQYGCDICKAVFYKKDNLRCHIISHSGKKDFLCDICGKSFTRRAYIKVHKLTHTGERPHTCRICNKSFVTSSAYKIHSRTHTGERPFCCEMCGNAYATPHSLQIHMNTHTKLKPFPCPTCGKSFACKASIKNHIRSHSSMRAYACSKCDKTFKYHAHLYKHKRVHKSEFV